MLLDVRIEDGVSIVRINTPRIEARIADELTDGLVEALTTTGASVIDFSQVGFIDSVGMKSLMTVLLHCRRCDGACVLHGVTEDIMSVFVITRLNKLLPIEGDEAAAVSRIREIVRENNERALKG
ncbi:MAG: STAS domain-containing protein [Acidobacteriota bacterium]